MMISMFFGGFFGSNVAGLLIDRFGRVKILGICAITAGLTNETIGPFTLPTVFLDQK